MARLSPLAILGALVLSLGWPPASVEAQVREKIRFEVGQTEASVEGAVTGADYHDYILGAAAGQTMSVSLISDKVAFFNILPPGSDDAAIYNGSILGENATVTLPATGEYTVRVYLMGEDRDTGVTIPYTLSFAIL